MLIRLGRRLQRRGTDWGRGGTGRSRRLLLACGLGLLIAAAGTARGSDITVSPIIHRPVVRPGRAHSYAYSITNNSDKQVHCTISAVDMTMTLDGRPTGGTGLQRGAGKWFSFSPSELDLRPKQSDRVVATVTAPRGSAGGYYALVCFTVAPPRPSDPAAMAGIVFGTQIACPVLIVCPASRMPVHLSTKELALAIDGVNGAWTASCIVSNTGGIHVRLGGGTIWVIDDDGRLAARAALAVGQGYVLAESERRFAAEVPPLPDGVYTVRAEVATTTGRRLSGGAETFLVSQGEAHKGKPTPEMLAAVEVSRPILWLKSARQHYELPAGATRYDVLEVANVSDLPLTVTPRLLTWDQDADGALRFRTDSSAYKRSAVGMVRVTPASQEIGPHRKGSFRVGITVPRDASGEYYAAAVFLAAGEGMPAEPKIARARSTLLSVLVKGSAARATEIRGVSFQPHEDGGASFDFEVCNTGNAIAEFEGDVRVLSAEGQPAPGPEAQFAGQGTALVAGASARFTVPWTTVLKPGSYRAEIRVLPVGVEGGFSHATLDFVVKPASAQPGSP